LASGTISGVLVGAVVAVVGVTAAAVLIEPVEMQPSAPVTPVAEAPDPAPDTPPQAEEAEEAPVVTDEPEAAEAEPETETEVEPPDEGADAQPQADVAEPVEDPAPAPEIVVTDTVEAEPEAADPVEPVEPEAQAADAADETPEPQEATGEADPEMAAPTDEVEPEVAAAPDEADDATEMTVETPEEPTVTGSARDGDSAPAAQEPEARAQLPTIVAPANPSQPDVALPEDDGTLRTAGQSVFDPPPIPEQEDRLEEDAPNPDADIVTGRLPSIGETAAQEAAEAGPQPAIRRNALPFERSPGLPEMAVVLLDTGAGRSEVGDLAVMPFPLSVAVDASAPDAQEAIRFYRSNGAEVVLIVPLPDLATAMDVEVTFQAYAPLMQDVVAVMIEPGAGFQGLGEAAAQVVTNVDEKGLGLITYPEGLNTGHKTAVRDDVPAGLVFRDLDGEGQGGDVIRRFLDNVAFRARNEEQVIAVARVKPESIQALLEWSLGNRAQTVDFAPVSAVLLDD
tara:strand:- start:3114 stop:4643 length:1530 start_codon:yes stop_codon:yes gene_type:complete